MDLMEELTHVDIRHSYPSDEDNLMKMVNEVYEQCEGHLWIPNRKRLTKERFTAHHDNRELFVAEMRGSEVVGCVTMSNSGDDGKELGMLVVKPHCRRLGVGRMLVDHVIKAAREADCNYVKVELLYPTHQPDPWKQILRRWYENMGFQFVKNEDLTLYFADAADVVQEVTFSIFEKPLNG